MNKTDFLDFLAKELNDRMTALSDYAKSLEESLTGESKSTAGDKHDTGRAMIHLEQEKLSKQFEQLGQQQRTLDQIRHRSISPKHVESGSLIKLDNQIYFIGVPAGKIDYKEQSVWCIGHQAPLAKLLIGKENGQLVTLGGQAQRIEFI
jgi:hypothetical protein